jgi:hypothetical protein
MFCALPPRSHLCCTHRSPEIVEHIRPRDALCGAGTGPSSESPSSDTMPRLHLPSSLHDRRLSQLSRVPPLASNPYPKDTQIAQDTSADATNAHHLENPGGPRRTTRRARPIGCLEHISAGRKFFVIKLSSHTPLFSFCLGLPLSILRLPQFPCCFSTFPLLIVAAITLAFALSISPLPHELISRIEHLSLLAYITPRLASPNRGRCPHPTQTSGLA